MAALPNKKKDISFYDPKGEMEAQRKKMLAENLIGKSREDFKNETAGGMTVARSPWEFAGKAAQGAVGEFEMSQAEDQAAEIEKRRQQAMSEALSQYGEDPQAAAMILGQDPRTSDMAMQLMQGEVDYGRDQERFEQQMGLKREQMEAMNQRSMNSGRAPAPMQIANQMFELEQAMNNPELPDQDRFLAERQYNLLGQAAKTYGFDRGMQAQAFGGYDSVYGQPSQQNQPQMGGQQDPMQASQQAVMQQQQDIGVNPYQRQNLQAPSVGSIPGYDQAMATREGMQSGASERAKLQERLDLEPEIARESARMQKVGSTQGERETSLQESSARIPQLQNMVERLDQLGNEATYTITGRGRDVAMREMGMDVPDSAVARAQYISMVDNEILPLLRQTFGAQFTEREGTRLIATLGDPNASPQEKNARLRAFIRTKMEDVNTQARTSGVEQPFDQSYIDSFVEGLGGQQQAPQQPQGQIAVNPQTGERLINRGNGWEPYNGD